MEEERGQQGVTLGEYGLAPFIAIVTVSYITVSVVEILSSLVSNKLG